VGLEGLGQLKKSSDFIGNRNHNLPACSIVSQPNTLPRAPNRKFILIMNLTQQNGLHEGDTEGKVLNREHASALR
jgi:hypothetical protein